MYDLYISTSAQTLTTKMSVCRYAAPFSYEVKIWLIFNFFDTTLRDGEQTPGVNFNQQEKIQIARQLETYGIDVIEAGFPIASDGDFHSVKEIASVIKTATVCGLARSVERDIDRAYEALRNAANAQVHVFSCYK